MAIQKYDLGYGGAPNVAPMLADVGRSLAQMMQDNGRLAREGLARRQQERQTQNFFADAQNIDPTSADFPQQLMGVLGKNQLAVNNPAVRDVISQMAQINQNATNPNRTSPFVPGAFSGGGTGGSVGTGMGGFVATPNVGGMGNQTPNVMPGNSLFDPNGVIPPLPEGSAPTQGNADFVGPVQPEFTGNLRPPTNQMPKLNREQVGLLAGDEAVKEAMRYVQPGTEEGDKMLFKIQNEAREKAIAKFDAEQEKSETIEKEYNSDDGFAVRYKNGEWEYGGKRTRTPPKNPSRIEGEYAGERVEVARKNATTSERRLTAQEQQAERLAGYRDEVLRQRKAAESNKATKAQNDARLNQIESTIEAAQRDMNSIQGALRSKETPEEEKAALQAEFLKAKALRDGMTAELYNPQEAEVVTETTVIPIPDSVMQEFNDALSKGKPRNSLIQRMKEKGYDTSALEVQ